MTEQRPIEFTTIDFDDAHQHWIQNKRKLSNGMYRYICIGFFQNGKKCNRNPLVGKNTCKIHDINPITQEEETKIEYEPEILTKQKPQLKNTCKIETTVRTVRGFACKTGVSGWRIGTPSGLSGGELLSNDNDSAKSTEIEIKYRRRSPDLQKYTNHMSEFVRSFWKTYRTLPVEEFIETQNKTNGLKPVQDPIIDVHNETILTNIHPPRYIKFTELQKAFDKYGSIDKVRNPATIRKNRYNILDVAYYLQIMLVFLEGLDEMTKLSSKHICVMMMKSRLLLFVNYDTNMHLHTTEAKWRVIGNNIRDELLYVLDDIYEEIDDEDV